MGYPTRRSGLPSCLRSWRPGRMSNLSRRHKRILVRPVQLRLCRVALQGPIPPKGWRSCCWGRRCRTVHRALHDRNRNAVDVRLIRGARRCIGVVFVDVSMGLLCEGDDRAEQEKGRHSYRLHRSLPPSEMGSLMGILKAQSSLGASIVNCNDPSFCCRDWYAPAFGTAIRNPHPHCDIQPCPRNSNQRSWSRP